MSHHVHMLPGIIPVDRPLASVKKRRLKKARASALGQAGSVSAFDDEDEDFYLSADDQMEESPQSTGQNSGSYSGRFTSQTMRALLEVQEAR